ncbi:hypothetical protein [Pelagibius sp.]|uniref:hypothetical protein n=1 Tax=Pelagibius sp. TaxID=1931238 RepID=UPI003BAF1BF5
MDRSEVKEIAHEAAKEAVRETLEALGIDTQNPAEERADRVFLRGQRVASAKVAMAVRIVFITTACSGLAWVIWEGFRLAVRVKGS